MASVIRDVLAEVRRRALRWWTSPLLAVVRLLPQTDLRSTVALAAVVAVVAILPAMSILASGILVSNLPGSVAGGLRSASGTRLLASLCALGLVLVATEAVGRLSSVLASALGSRLDARLQEDVMSAVSSPAGIDHLEDVRVQDLISRAGGIGVSGYTPGDAVAGLSVKVGLWAQGSVAAVLLIPFHWWLPVPLVAVQLLRGRVMRREYLRQAVVWNQQSQLVRRAGYYRDLALAPEAAKEIRLIALARWLVERFRSEYLAALSQVRAHRRGEGLPGILVAVLVTGATLAALALLGWDATQRTIGLGALVVYIRAVLGVAGLAGLGIQDFQIEYGTAGVQAALALRDRFAASPRPNGIPPPAGMPRTGIVFRDVTFTYPGAATPALNRLDLDVPAGRSLAIVGLNGAGKTTFAKLVCRLRDPDRGVITVDGVDLRSVDARAWQRRVAAVFQDFTRLELSAADNVALGANGDAGTRSAVRDAAANAGIRDRIESLASGWDTPLARHLPGGAELSGGEWQRLALARALFAVRAGASVLILDEPTASLDARAEAAFYDRFLDLTSGLTTILISHRFSTVRRADTICVLDGGRVSEAGSHNDLLTAGGSYARMFELQSSRFTDDEDAVGS